MYYLIPAEIIFVLEAFIELFSLLPKEGYFVSTEVPGVIHKSFKFTGYGEKEFEKIKTFLSLTVSENEAEPSSG